MPDHAQAALTAALARLDAVFADPPPLAGPVRGCGYCWDGDELAALAAPPAEVPEEVLRSFIDEVVDHLDFDDQYTLLWRRLAPRALRRIAAGEHDLDFHNGIKLGDYGAKLATWPEPERAAVTDVLDALLRVHVATYPDGNLVDILEGLAATSGDAATWLDRLTPDPAADPGLLAFAVELAEWALWQGIGVGGTPSSKLTAQTAAWLVGPVFTARLDRHLATHPHCHTALDAAAAVNRLRTHDETSPQWSDSGRCTHA